MPALALKDDSQFDSSGGRLVAADGRTLPLKGAAVKGDAKGGLARVVLTQRFANAYSEPLSVTYAMPLPADGAVSGYAFTFGGTRIVGEVDKKASARERFEQAILEGKTAALLDQERSSLFTQQVGNIPPGAEVVCELTIDQKLTWLPEGEWEWRFPTVAAPRYLGEEGRVGDAARVSLNVAESGLSAQVALAFRIRDGLSINRRPESPSHSTRCSNTDDGWSVQLADERGAALDRDLVVRWAVAAPRVGLSLDCAGSRFGAFGLVTMVPPSFGQRLPPISRDLIVLLDTSGSMSGQPLEQAVRVVSALVDTLHEQDRLEMIEFSNSPRRWKRGAVNASESHKSDALHWLQKLRASGGTEMREGVLEALKPLNHESQRQIVLVTDGLIGFEQEIIATLLDKLPTGARFHTVGVGSAVNRSLTGPAARAGKGVELVIGLAEDPESAARRLIQRTDAPQVVEIEVTGSALAKFAPQRLPDLFGEAPTLLSVQLHPRGGQLVVRGRTHEGEFEQRLEVPPIPASPDTSPLAALFARERAEDLEMQIASGHGPADADQQIEKLGIEFQISTRLTSWLAVTSAAMVDPRAPTRRETLPQGIPHGMSVEGLGLRASVSRVRAAGAAGSLSGQADGGPAGLLDAYLAPAAAPRPPSPSPVVSVRRADKKRRREAATGRIVLNADKHWVFEVTLSERFTWDPSQPILVTLEDGRTLEFTVDAQLSTQPGAFEAGLTVRVAVPWGHHRPSVPRSATIKGDNGALEVTF